MTAPVRSGAATVGFLAAHRSRGQRACSGEGALLQVFANQAGLLLENRELVEANLAKIQQFLALQRISRQMTSTLEPQSLVRLVVQEALVLTGAEGSSLYLIEGAAGDRLALQARAGEALPPGREEVAVGYGIVGWVARAGSALRVSDRGAGRTEFDYLTRKSQLAVPLLSEGRVLGVLAVEATRGEAFSATHEEFLSIFAAQAAKAIEAGRFFDQIRAERDLRESILRGSPNGVVALDAARRVILMNQAARRLLGVDEEPAGQPIERYVVAPDFRERVGRILDERSPLETLELALTAAGRPVHLVLSIFSLGPGRGATLIFQDLTERRRLDERVQRMARLASIGQLAAGIAHEIRNPLTGLAISADILREETGLSEDGRNLLDDMNREIDRLESLIRGLLDFARPQPAEFRPMRIAKALEWHRTFREQCRKKGVEFRFDLRGNPKIEGDPEKLKQLFLNLAINALEATPAGGEIQIRAEGLAGETAGWARVVVEDTGPGMDPDTAAQIFHPFFTTKNEGTGLGLSIAYSVAEQHGGRIDVHSIPGRGSRFTVDLPAREEE